ncbi:hypothetical protein niasHT_008214 [Heterodera trifolii]|uniref:G-protein coupled receptors family 1 profile domain-containing protein n=1 Tax=Heterodera trifolii TaxID=157864 RepID=A0ABD2LUE7_9BILA
MSGSYFVLAEFILAVIFHSVAIVQIFIILRSNVRKNISLFFTALFGNSFCAALLLLPYEIYSIIVWRPTEGALYDGATLFFIALPAHLLLSTIPMSVFFMTIDRICIILFELNYGSRIKRVLKRSFFCALSVGILFNFIEILSAMPVPTKTECEIFGCILGTSVQLYLGWRAFCAILNTISGILFFVVLYRSNRKMASTTKMLNNAGQLQIRRANRVNNLLTSVAIVSELFISFLPHFLPFVCERVFGAGSSLGTGPLSELMNSFEVLLFSSIYSYKFLARNNASVHGTGGTLQQQQQSYRMETNYSRQNVGRTRSDRVVPMAPGQPQPAQILIRQVTPVENVNGRPRTSMARY